ncbi:Putative uncharacterized protein [Moritella viscosa]|nr:Putative uncharacterized protein [Moritella viscosa]
MGALIAPTGVTGVIKFSSSKIPIGTAILPASQRVKFLVILEYRGAL